MKMLRTVSNIKKEIDLLEAVNFSDIVKDKEKTAVYRRKQR